MTLKDYRDFEQMSSDEITLDDFIHAIDTAIAQEQTFNIVLIDYSTGLTVTFPDIEPTKINTDGERVWVMGDDATLDIPKPDKVMSLDVTRDSAEWDTTTMQYLLYAGDLSVAFLVDEKIEDFDDDFEI